LVATNLIPNINQRDASHFDDDFLHAINIKCQKKTLEKSSNDDGGRIEICK
jgi:hypothetical protein